MAASVSTRRRQEADFQTVRAAGQGLMPAERRTSAGMVTCPFDETFERVAVFGGALLVGAV